MHVIQWKAKKGQMLSKDITGQDNESINKSNRKSEQLRFLPLV